MMFAIMKHTYKHSANDETIYLTVSNFYCLGKDNRYPKPVLYIIYFAIAEYKSRDIIKTSSNKLYAMENLSPQILDPN